MKSRITRVLQDENFFKINCNSIAERCLALRVVLLNNIDEIVFFGKSIVLKENGDEI
jgi:hypothetical protein